MPKLAVFIRCLYFLTLVSSPTPQSAAAAEPGERLGGLTFACSADNDLYRALHAGGASLPRFASGDEAVAQAKDGTGVLILADGYPATRTAISRTLLERAKAKKLRLYLEYPDAFPGIDFGPARVTKWERGVVASDSLGKTLPKLRILGLNENTFIPAKAESPILVMARVAGFDAAVYGLPAETFPVLFRPEPDVLISTTKLSDFIRARYAPTALWAELWRQLLTQLDPVGPPPALVAEPGVRPMWTRDEAMPRDAERQAASKFAKWIVQSHLLIAPTRDAAIRKILNDGAEVDGPPAKNEPIGDGSLGITEGYASQIHMDGGQMRRVPVRADCQAESAAVLAFNSWLEGDANSAAIAKNLLNFTYFTSEMCKGGRGDPTHPAFGLIAWGDVIPAWRVANYGDDNARTLLATIAAAACLKSDAWDASILKGLLANLRTTGQLGFRTDRIDMSSLEINGWRHFNDGKPINPALNFEAYPWACFLWAYHRTGHREFLDKSKAAIRITMDAYPDGWRWGDNMERARMLLPLAWLVRVEDTPEHRAWLDRIATDLLENQDACGAIQERLKGAGGGHYVIPASNEAYGTSETPLIQQNGDTVSDQLYTSGFALLGLHEAAAVTHDPKLVHAADKLAEYLTRIQVRSDAQPYLDGAWFRAFDYGKWEYWASSADLGWGAWSVEAGWCQSWTAITLALRAKGASFWDLTDSSKIDQQMAGVQKLMAVNTGGPWSGGATK